MPCKFYFLIFMLISILQKPPLAFGKEEEKSLRKTTKQEWMDLQNKVMVLEAKIRTGEEALKKLISDKNSSKDELKTRQLVQQIKIQHKELTQHIKDYQTERNILMYRYPERSVETERQYEKKQLLELEDFENQLTVEGRIKTVLQKAEQKYPNLTPDSTPLQEVNRQPATEKKQNQLHKPIILSQ